MRSNSTLASAPLRPRLTALVESMLRASGPGTMGTAAKPIASVPRRLLIVKVHGLGDSVLIRLIIEQLRERNPDMDIGVLAGPATREVLTMGTSLRVHAYSQKELSMRSAFITLRDIRRAGYEAVLNFEQGSLAGTAFIGCTGIPIRLGFVPLGDNRKAKFLTHGLHLDESRSMWQSFVALARMVDRGLTEAVDGIPIALVPETENWVRAWWCERVGDEVKNPVAFHLGSGQGMDYRRWPLENFIALAEMIRAEAEQVAVILTGTALERPLIKQFMMAYRGRSVDASDTGSIEYTAAILRRTRLLVSVDTGVMHLGAALGVPTVGIFGPNSPAHWAPIGPRATFVYDTNATCSPCINNYYNRTPTHCTNADQARCMRDVNPQSVLAAARHVVGSHFLG